MIKYSVEKDLGVEDFRKVLINSTLGERRPVNEPERLLKMLENADLILTARHNGKLVGVSRSLTDFQLGYTPIHLFPKTSFKIYLY